MMKNYNASQQQFATVSKTMDGQRLELPTDPEKNTLSIHTLHAAFPDAHGLKYIAPGSGHFRTLRVDDTATKFYPPPGGWHSVDSFIVLLSDSVMYEWSLPTQNLPIVKREPPQPFQLLSAPQMQQQYEPMVQSSTNIGPMVPFGHAALLINNDGDLKEVMMREQIDPPHPMDTGSSDDSNNDHQALFRAKTKRGHPPPAELLDAEMCGPSVGEAPKTAEEETRGPSRSVPLRKAANAARLAMQEQNLPLNIRYTPRDK